MTATEFLKQSVQIYRQIECTLEQLQGIQDLGRRITPILNGTPTAGNRSYSRIEAAVLKMQEQSEILSEKLAEYLTIREQIAAAINLVADENERLILESRYLNFKSWRYIARLLNVKQARVYQLHNQALRSFEKIFSERTIAN